MFRRREVAFRARSSYSKHDHEIRWTFKLGLQPCTYTLKLRNTPRRPLLQHMLAFDEVWPADLPALRPLRLNLRRPCRTRVAAPTGPGLGPVGRDRGKGDGNGGGRDGGPDGYGGPVFLMPMHREGKGVQGRCGVFLSHRGSIYIGGGDDGRSGPPSTGGRASGPSFEVLL